MAGVIAGLAIVMWRLKIVKGIFNLSLRALEGFLNSLFTLMSASLKSSDYTSISKRAKTVNIKYCTPVVAQ